MKFVFALLVLIEIMLRTVAFASKGFNSLACKHAVSMKGSLLAERSLGGGVARGFASDRVPRKHKQTVNVATYNVLSR